MGIEAAAQGNTEAMVYLGARHEAGTGVARDPSILRGRSTCPTRRSSFQPYLQL